ncbi:MAG: methylated-DNA--[Bacteroidales bacterium]|nr:methylated-DNA--[protein]-cysteine S-methyltransferase [Bacteroidales bacterium]
MDYVTYYSSPIGKITIASDSDAIVGLWFDNQKHYASVLDSNNGQQNDLPIFKTVFNWLDIYFGGNQPNFTPKINMRGSCFQRCVWNVLLSIPYGKVVTYGTIAKQLNCRSAQAVGGAVGRNPISIIVPCHRVVGTNGKLTGYAGGIDKKHWLLNLENNFSLLNI